MIGCRGFLLAVAAAVFGLWFFTPMGSVADEPPYHVEDGKVDKGTFNGYRRFMDYCSRCHGQYAVGSSFAPSLVDSLKHLDYQQFAETVINGRQNTTAGQEKVMPAFGYVEDVATYLDDIYGYLKARSDGALPIGRPNRIGG